MKKMITVTLLTLGLSAAAQARVNTWELSCSEARNLVQSSGAIVMNYGVSNRAGYLYDRFVSHSGYCSSGEVTRSANVPTTDNSRCYVGYTCVPHQR